MASGNSWQVYQELGTVPEALKQFPQLQTSRRRHDRLSKPIIVTEEESPLPLLGEKEASLLKTSRTNLGYLNDGYNPSDRGSSSLERRRHSFSSQASPDRLIRAHSAKQAAEILKRKWSQRRQSHSFRLAKERGRQLWRRAKTFIDVTVLGGGDANLSANLDTSGGSSTTNTYRLNNDEEDDDDENELFTTASDLSGLAFNGGQGQRIDDEDDDEYLDFSQIIPIDLEKSDENHVELYQRRKPSIISNHYRSIDPNCPIHGGNSIHQKKVTIAAARQPPIITQRKGRRFGIGIDQDPAAVITAAGSNRRLTTTSGDDGNDNTPFILKLARRRHKASLTSSDRLRVAREKSKIIRNLCILSVAFLFLISAFQGLQNLQTTIHGENGLGAISLSMVYVGLVISCLFTPPYLLNRIGCKLTLILSMSTFSIYMLTHFLPKWYSLIPGSLLIGFGLAPLWAAKCAYLSETGFRYAELNLESPNVVIVRFFGIFFMVLHMGQVFGNLISSWILRAAIGSGLEPIDNVDETCGHFFSTDLSNLSPIAKSNLARPSHAAVYSLCAVYFCCTIVAELIIGMFLNELRSDLRVQKEKPHFKLDIWNTTIQHLKKPRHLLLVPLTIFNGMQQAFIAGEFTKAYVGCCLGITHIGYVMMSFGIFDAICSLVFGPLIKLFGRMPLLMFGAVVDMLMIFTLVVWPPNSTDIFLFYVIAACWGMADGVWSTQINGLWVVTFADNLAAAFANYRLWESVGFIIAFSYTPFFKTETKLYILLAMLYVGMLGYGLIEVWKPLEDYAVQLKQKLILRSSLKTTKPKLRRQGNRLKKRKNGTEEDSDVTENLLGSAANRTTIDRNRAPLALQETDF